MRPDVVVFPEYSLPVERALPRLQAKADEYNQIIIAGSDTFHDPKTNKIFNQSPVIVPGRKAPVWARKYELSQWEAGYVDQPARAEIPLLTWEANGRSYWMAVYIGVEFLLAPLDKMKGAGIFIVPMSSSDTNVFQVYADTLLRNESGTATVLCNSVGEGSGGRSSVTAVVPGVGLLKPAIVLPEETESVAVFEIDCSRLVPPRKATPGMSPPLGKRYIYALHSKPEGFDFTPLLKAEAGEKGPTRGVINPAIFDLLGKKMRMAFLATDRYMEVAEKIKDQNFEVLAVLGHHDLLITHLHENRYDMIYDIMQTVPMKSTSDMDRGLNRENFPYFRVDVYFKVLGVKIHQEDRVVFDGPDKQIPSFEQLTEILRLSRDWEDSEVPDEARRTFIEKRWILDRTATQPGAVSAVMTVFLDYAARDMTQLFADFEDRVLPVIVNMSAVTSAYRGRAQNLPIHYVLRITADTNSLFSLIEEIHRLASDARVIITTNTYIVARKISSLSLQHAVLLPELPSAENHYRNTQILPVLSPEERVRVVYLPVDEQIAFVEKFRLIEGALTQLSDQPWLQGRLSETKKQLAKGLLYTDFGELREVHDLLQSRVEKLLDEFIRKQVADEEFEKLRDSLKIPSAKKKSTLTYSERIRLASRAVEERHLSPGLIAGIRSLVQTIQVRNALAHGDESRLTLETYVETLLNYSKFLSEWER
jgi:hypothetical protein